MKYVLRQYNVFYGCVFSIVPKRNQGRNQKRGIFVYNVSIHSLSPKIEGKKTIMKIIMIIGEEMPELKLLFIHLFFFFSNLLAETSVTDGI